MGQPVLHWEIAAKDGPKAQEFYATMFGWHIDANNPMNYGMVQTESHGGINGGIFQTDDGSRRMTLYVQVPDLQAALDQAVSLGGASLMPPHDVGGGTTIAMCTDLEGNVLGLVKG